MAARRSYDVVVWGATGFTGRIVSEYFANHVVKRLPNLRWAIAGRNQQSLEGVRNSLNLPGPNVPSILIGDSTSPATVKDIVGSTQVMLCCAGPFLQYGIPVVEACATLGTDYVDITGETPFVKRNQDKLDQAARENNSLIVSMCGFDSLPSDLGTFRTAKLIHERFGEKTARVHMFVQTNGSFSGGTMATGIMMEENPELAAQQDDPFLLGGGPSSGARPVDADVEGHAFNEEVSGWTAPFMMGKLNTRIVRWSASLEPSLFTNDFNYQEYMLLPNEDIAKKVARPAPPADKRKKMVEEGRLPKQGEGPDEERRKESFFHFKFIGESETGKKVITTVAGGDPGYTETSKMISEAALCMVTDRNRLNATGGVLPPAFVFGDVLIEKLAAAGIVFGEEPSSKL